MDFTDVRVRLAVTFAVILGCWWLIHPVSKTINLGLDLKGGVHMVMRVRTDDAVKAEVDLARERIRSSFAEKGITTTPSPDQATKSITFTGIDAARMDEARTLVHDQFPQYNVDQPAAGTLRLALRVNDESGIRDSAVRQALETIRTRIDKFGVAEPVIQRKGVGPQADQIVVQLPGVEDPERVKGLIGEAAFLEWKLVKIPPGVTAEMFRPGDSEATLKSAFGGELPADVVALPQDVVQSDGRRQTFWWPVTRSSPITGNDLKNARRDADRFGGPAVNFLLSAEAGKRFQELTRANQGQMLAIVLDQKIISAPRINAVIAERGIIEGGNFTVESSEDLALKLRSGALPAGLDILEERTVADSIQHGIIATIAGAILIVLFMLAYYHLAGVNANVALVANILIVLAAMAVFHSTLTLPGIAGMALTVGMAVDANVLVFERIREELRHGRTVRGAINLGFERAFATIIDSHCTTLIAGFALLSFGTGPVKGFAVTLSVGIVANLFTSLFMSRALFDTLLWINPRTERLSI
jgi:preprotein translocase subunit SecD